MPFQPPTQQDIDKALDVAFAAFANDAASAIFGSNPIPRDITFAQMEKLSSDLSRRVAQRFTERMLEQHTQETSSEVACPQCGRSCRVVQHKRPIQTLEGDVIYREPACHCETCRRNFFSGTSESAAR
jgi:hypothetical protein